MNSSDVLLTTVILNWNRIDLLRVTLESYLNTVSVPHEVIVVDNASTDGSSELVRSFCSGRQQWRALLLRENHGGDAYNIALEQGKGAFLHISENDIEYLPGWDVSLLEKFQEFPQLGQLSPFSPFHQVLDGEIAADKPALRRESGKSTIYVALANVGSTCVIRREVWERGVRWNSLSNQNFSFPDDGQFSADVKREGFLVAWNDRYVVKNWGHNITEFRRRVQYYLQNAEDKQWFRLEGLIARLREHGYDLRQCEDGNREIVQVQSPENTVAFKKSQQWKEWLDQLAVAREELLRIAEQTTSLIFVDDNMFGSDVLPEKRVLPFLEREGEPWGAPADDQIAIEELERMRSEGAGLIAFAWVSFWWLEHYARFREHLEARFPCVLRNERLIVFDLSKASARA